MKKNNSCLLTVENLVKHFPAPNGNFSSKKQWVRAVNGVTFGVKKGETFAIVGESGCGKSTLGRLVLGLLKPNDGQVKFQGKDLSALNPQELRALRSSMQIIFQDPFASLNPRMKIGDLIIEPMKIHQMGDKKYRKNRCEELINAVGLNVADLSKYPHEFSGGQRQRIGIARALAPAPELVVCDEPVSALDVSVQAQILNLLQDLQEKFQLTYIFISHNLSVVKYMSDRIAVMYLGKIVEIGRTDQIFSFPLHPYTKALISSFPNLDPDIKVNRIILTGDVPNPLELPNGCIFYPRCYEADEYCRQNPTQLREIDQNHYVACHKYNKLFQEVAN